MTKTWNNVQKPQQAAPRSGAGALTLTAAELALAKSRISATNPDKIAKPYRNLWRNVSEAILIEDYKWLSEKQYEVIKINFEIQNKKQKKRRIQSGDYTETARFNSFYNEVGKIRNW